MKNYLDLMIKCRDEGIDVFNERTQKTCRTLVGVQLEYDLSKGFPAVTSKRLAFKAVKGELLGFFRGYTNAADFRSLDCQIWNANANETKAWLDNPFRKGEDDLGAIYAKQWTAWENFYVVPYESKITLSDMEKLGYYKLGSGITGDIYKKVINQLELALKTIITNPSDRRIIVTGWNPGDIDKACLPACHMDYRFTPIGDTLHVVMTIRSWDAFLGASFNIASTALFLSIMARLSGYKPGKTILQGTNFHIYQDHFEALEQQLANPLYGLPTLHLSDNIKQITDIKDIPGVFTRINPEDISLVNYKCNEAIKAKMAA